MRDFFLSVAFIIVLLFQVSCGRAPSSLLRQQQLPVYDFPLYVTEGVPGKVWKYLSNGTRELLVSGLNDPRGVATDRFGNLYVVELGANRLLKVNASSGSFQVFASGLSTPSVVAVDSFGEAFVAQDGTKSVIRASDKSVVATYSQRPTALAMGVSDLMIVGLFDSDTVFWGKGETSVSATVAEPVNVSIDGSGRVYVAEGKSSGARVIRFNQREPGGAGTVVADQLEGPQGIAVDPVGNIYVVEQGAGRIILVSYQGTLYTWTSGLIDPQYLAFTQY